MTIAVARTKLAFYNKVNKTFITVEKTQAFGNNINKIDSDMNRSYLIRKKALVGINISNFTDLVRKASLEDFVLSGHETVALITGCCVDGV